MVAGFVSFPIFTRVFSVADYGMLGLLNSTLFIAIAISKFGLQESAVRFHEESKSTELLSTLYSTLFLTTVFLAVISAAPFAIISKLMPRTFDENIHDILIVFSLIIFFRSTGNILTGFLRAQQKTKLYNLIAIAGKYLSLTLSISLVYFFSQGLHGYYIGILIIAVLNFFFLLYVLQPASVLRFSLYSNKVIIRGLQYGFPLVLAELGHLILNYADRYLIKLFLNPFSLGIYTAGYNLATQVSEVIIYPINYAMFPILLKITANDGDQPAREFLSRLFSYFLLIMIPVTFGFLAIGKDLIVFLASTRYSQASQVLPYVVSGQAIYACSFILSVGLYLQKKTYIVALIMLSSCVANGVLNILLIPSHGIVGAAQATLISYTIFTIVITYYAFQYFSFPIRYTHIFRYLAAGTIMYIILLFLQHGNHLVNLAIKILTGICLYTGLILLLDKHLRHTLTKNRHFPISFV